jgi:DNA-binding SARP family transcriptional activator
MIDHVDVEILGPLRIRVAGPDFLTRTIEPPSAPADRRLLAELLVHCGHTVSTGHLAEAIWPDRLPARPGNAIQVRVSRLRGWLTAAGAREVVRTTATGYVLSCTMDTAEFTRTLRDAATYRAAGRHADAARGYARAVELWRDRPFGDVAATACVAAETERLEELYLSALDERAELGLALREPAGPIADVARRVLAAHPLRERTLAILMAALVRDGQRDAALRAYRDGRARIVRELGVEPGVALQEAHLAIMRPAPVAPPMPAPQPVRHALPRRLRDFTGREKELRQLVEQIRRDPLAENRSANPVDVVTIDGMAGVGKSVFAVQVAYALADDYPDVQLCLDLGGYSAGVTPLTAEAALFILLGCLGVAAETIPAGLPERTALWRHRLAGRRGLVILDDAVSAEQIIPLLPGHDGTLVLVTSWTSTPRRRSPCGR